MLPALLAPGCRSSVTESLLPLAGGFRVQAAVGDSPDGCFVFDTGSSHTFVVAKAADAWNLPAVERPPGQVTDATQTSIPIRRHVRLGSMRIGDTRFRAFVAPVLPSFAARDVDGVIGADAMAPLAWVVDGPAARLRVMESGTLERRLAELYPGARWSAVPLRRQDQLWLVTLPIVRPQPESVTLLLDTGAEGSSLPAAVIASLQLPDGQAEHQRRNDAKEDQLRRELEAKGVIVGNVQVSGGGVAGASGTARPCTYHLLDGLRLGRVQVDSLLITDTDQPAGTMGADVLGKLVWALDGPQNRLLVRDP